MAARDDKRPPTDGEVVEYVATLIFITLVLSIVTSALLGCTCDIAV